MSVPQRPPRSLFDVPGTPAPAQTRVNPGVFSSRVYEALDGDLLVPWNPPSPAFKQSTLFSFRGVPPGTYDLVPYEPINLLGTFITAHALYAEGVRPQLVKAKPDIEVQKALMFGLLLSVKGRALHQSPTHLLAGAPSRISTLNLNNVNPESLGRNAVAPKLVFKEDNFIMYHAANTFTLLALTSLPPRMEVVLTSV